jgi:hypothetical protein
MANELALSFKLDGTASLTDLAMTIALPNLPFTIGGLDMDALEFELADGTGTDQANELYVARTAIGIGANLDLDLYGSLLNFKGDVINFTAIKLFLVTIQTPDGVKKIRVGPQGLALAAQLWFGGVTANFYEETTWHSFHFDRYAGWPIVSGVTDKVRIANVGGTALSVNIVIAGTK